MKKLLALLLSAALLLGACAFAEEAVPVTHSHKLSDVFIILGEKIIDLSDLSVELDVSGTDKPDAARIHLNSKEGAVANIDMAEADGGDEVDATQVGEQDNRVALNSEDGTIAEIGVTMVDGNYIIHLESEELGHVDYAIDPVALISQFLDQGVDGLVKLLQSLDTTEMAQSIVDLFNNAGAAVEGPEAVGEPEAAEEPEAVEAAAEPALRIPSISIEGDIVAALTAGLSEPETVNMGGVEYGPGGTEIIVADGVYTTQEITIDTETLCTVLNMIYVDGQPSGWGDLVRDTGISFEVHGTFQSGEEEGLNQIASVTATLDDGESLKTMYLDLDTFYVEEGETTAVSYGLTMDGQTMGVSFNLTRGQHQGELFTPDAVDMDDAIVLTDMELGEAFETLGESLNTLNLEAMSAIIGPVMEAMMADVDLGALQAETEAAAAQ